MLTKRHKLDLRADRDFFKDALKKRCSGSILYFRDNKECFKTTLIVSKKVAPLSSTRNALKRYYYNNIQEILPQIEDWQISLVVVIVEPDRLLSVADTFQNQILKCISEVHHQYEKDSY